MKRTMQCYKPLWCFKQGCPCARCDDVMAVQQIVCVWHRKMGRLFLGQYEACIFAVMSFYVANMTNMIISNN